MVRWEELGVRAGNDSRVLDACIASVPNTRHQGETMPKVSALFTLLLIFSAAVVLAAPRLVYPCYQAPGLPAIDGQVRGLPVATGFSVLGDGYTKAKQTAVQACWDQNALYLAIVCEEPDAALMKFSVTDGGDAWLDDGIEIFLQPGGEKAPVYQLVVTARGARSCGAGTPDFTKVQAAAHTGADFYSLELRIPHEVTQTQPVEGQRWRGNVCRNIFTKNSGGDQFTSWAPLTRQFNEPEHFAEIVLMGAVPGSDALAGQNRDLNRDYRRHLLQGLRDVADQDDEYATVIKEATKDPEFGRRARDLRRRWRRMGRRARDLRRRWRRMGRMLRDADGFATGELRTAAKDAENLLSASYGLKYKYLIEKLLREN